MLKNYFKTAWRSLWKNRTFSLINIVGLTVGMTCCLLMVLFIQHELSYDKFHTNGDRIVRVIMEYRFGAGESSKGNFTSAKVFPAFKQNFPEVVDGVRMSPTERLVKYKDDVFNEKKFVFADSTFFTVFNSFKLLRGKADQVLKDPFKIVITESTARKYFGSVDNAIDKIVQVGSSQKDCIITGVCEDLPSNSQIKFDFVASFSSMGPPMDKTYWNANYTTYLLLRNKESIKKLQAKIEPFMAKEMKSLESDVYVNFELEPLSSVHLYSAFDGFEPNSNIKYIYIISAIAVLILVIACFTYINLSTARSMERAKEVGIRKVAGAVKGQVFWQFITESFLLSTLALVLSLAVASLLLPAFNHLTDRSFDWTAFKSPGIIGVSVGIVLVIAFLAGSYPALILSSFQPIKVLKGVFRNSGSGAVMRKSLIVFQFMISVFLIISTFAIQKQMHYIQNKNLGFNRENVIVLETDQKIVKQYPALRNEFRNNPDILAVSKSYETPVTIRGGYTVYRGDQSEKSEINATGNPVDEEYVKVNKLEMLTGADFTQQDVINASNDETEKNQYKFLINESCARALGWSPQEAIGKKIFLGSDRPGEVKGVLRDFHYASLHTKVQPLVLFPGGWSSTIMIRTTGTKTASTLAYLEAKWKAIAPHRPFEYRFMDEDFQKLYVSEMRMSKVFGIFSGIAIVLACLGLFGLSAYSAQQRLKEIGVRKVLGASILQIVVLLSESFLKLVLIAFLISVPVAWYATHMWLSDFAYRTDIGIGIFVIAALIVVMITLLTVSVQSIRAAMSNPVKSLANE